MNINLNGLSTEQRNPNTMNIDRVSTIEMLRIINREDQKVALAVEKVIEPIAQAVDAIAARIRSGGRLIYCGAGTSGRLGVLDASECPPTYGVDPGLVVGLIAGGPAAMFRAQEGCEDSFTLCEEDLKAIQFGAKDTLVGLAASGRTPYVIGGLKYANQIGALTVSITCNSGSEMESLATIAITPVVGPEVVSGSTRMKAGTAQKLVLNMISTGVMIRLNKVYENLMIDLQPNNLKLEERSRRIVMEATGADYEAAEKTLEATHYDIKEAILVLICHISIDEAHQRVEKYGGNLAKCIAG